MQKILRTAQRKYPADVDYYCPYFVVKGTEVQRGCQTNFHNSYQIKLVFMADNVVSEFEFLIILSEQTY
jgi:hypothetical protein